MKHKKKKERNQGVELDQRWKTWWEVWVLKMCQIHMCICTFLGAMPRGPVGSVPSHTAIQQAPSLALLNTVFH